MITQADVWAAFQRGQADTLACLADAADRRVAPHPYVSGVGHMTHPDDVIKCCPFGPGHPIHKVRLSAGATQ